MIAVPRLLRLAGLPSALRRYRLPSYSHLLRALQDAAGQVTRIACLWHGLFGEEMPTDRSEFYLLTALVARVDAELFRVDMTEMNHLQEMIWSMDPGAMPASVLDYPVPLDTYGIPWEMAGLDECRQDAVPLLAVVGGQLEDKAVDGGFDPNCIEESVYHYWADRDREPPAWGIADTGTAGIRVLQEALRLLPAPLDGLGVLIDCILRDSGSPWFDIINGDYRLEYDEDFEPWDSGETWDVPTLERYALMFARVQPAVERLDVYEEWFDGTKDAEDVVLSELERLAAGAWTIQDGEIIYYD